MMYMQTLLQQTLQTKKPSTSKPTAKLHLAFNIPNVDRLLPAFCEGELAVLYGAQNVDYLLSQLCIQAYLAQKHGDLKGKTVFIDTANNSTIDKVIQAAERQHITEQKLTSKIQYFRIYTASRLHLLLIEQLEQIIKTSNAKLVVISDMIYPFLTDDIDDQEAKTAYNHLINYLSAFAKKHKIIIVTTNRPHENNPRNKTLQETATKKAEILIRLIKTPYTSDVELEKHPKYMLGIMEFKPEIKTLTDY